MSSRDHDGGAEGALVLSEFEKYLEIHGASLERWPAPLAARAEELLRSSSEARRVRERAARLDALLDRAPEIAPSASLAARVASLPAAHPRRGFWSWWPFESISRPAFAWLAAAVVGIAVGRMLPADSVVDGADAVAGVSADELTDGADLDAQDWDDLAQLSLAYGFGEEE
jgi:hypothetical protein